MKPALFRHLINLYPPYLGAGVWVSHIAPDWSAMTVKLRLRFYNRNYVGTHYGGNLFTMTDPFHMLMLIHRLGGGYNVWDQKAEITFVKPGRGTVRAEMAVDQSRIDAIRAATRNGAKHLAEFEVVVVDEQDEIVATVHKTLYIREKRPAQTR
jgi:acyl-coenzyme A thioesterase PaaI-like protein